MRLLVIHEEPWTGGSSGISLPLNIGWKWIVFREKTNYVIIAFALFLLVLWASWLIRKSRIGHYLIAIREREMLRWRWVSTRCEPRFWQRSSQPC